MKGSKHFGSRSNNAIFQHFLPSQTDAIQSGKRQIFTRNMHVNVAPQAFVSAEVRHQAFRGAVMVEHQVVLGEVIQSCHTKFVPQETNEGKKQLILSSFCNLILQTWLVKWYWNLWRWFRITGNPETIFSPSPQHRKRDISPGWLQKPAVVFVRAPGCPWKSVTIYLVFDLLTRLTSYIYIGVIIHLLSTMEIHEHASSLPGWAGWFFQILNFF